MSYNEKSDEVAGTFTLTNFRVIWKHPKGKKLNVSIGLLSVYPDKFKFTHDLAEIRAQHSFPMVSFYFLDKDGETK